MNNIYTMTSWNDMRLSCVSGDIDTVRNYIDDKNDINETNESQQTFLHLACRYCHPDVVKLLLDNGAKINQLNMHGYSPFDYLHVIDNNDSVKRMKKMFLEIDHNLRYNPNPMPLSVKRMKELGINIDRCISIGPNSIDFYQKQ